MVGVRDPARIEARTRLCFWAFCFLVKGPGVSLPLSPGSVAGLPAWEWAVRARIKPGVPVLHFITQPPPGSAQATFFIDPGKLCLMFLLIL